MPYSNPKQAQAVFLSIARRQGMAAAKAFGRKHRGDLSRASKTSAAPYRARRKRRSGGDIF